jgi:hypothetical protein
MTEGAPYRDPNLRHSRINADQAVRMAFLNVASIFSASMPSGTPNNGWDKP